ncbi:MAG: 4Fe-4S dicluster domain-containing protein [Polyangiaceae bacterium]
MSTSRHRVYHQETDPVRRAASQDRPEFPEELPLGDRPSDAGNFTRRTFLSALGLSAAAFTAACGRSPVGHILPFSDKPEEMTPGVPLYYATTCGGCSAQCGALAKTRDGRPIKLEGNDRHPLSRGGLCAVGQASVLSLYDAARARGPSIGTRDTPWDKLDEEVKSGLAKAAAKGIFVVTPPDLGPTEEAALAKLLAANPGARRAIHDTTCATAIASAHAATHGERTVPRYRMDRAETVVAIDADILGTWLSPVSYTRQLASVRDARAKKMTRHVQIEPRLSLSGSCADLRLVARPSDTVPILAALARALGAKDLPADVAKVRAPEVKGLDRVTALLAAAKDKGLVVCGSRDPAAQILTNLVNHALGAYGVTVDLDDGMPIPEALTFDETLDLLKKQGAGAVMLRGVNPAYDHPRGAEIKALLAGVELTVAISDRRDETASLVKVHAPAHDPLESWGDARPARSVLNLRQPAVTPLFDTRSATISWLAWAGVAAAEDSLLRKRFEEEVFPKARNAPVAFDAFWDKALQDGFVELKPEPPTERTVHADVLTKALAGHAALSPLASGLEISLYEKVAIRDGRLANNGWLQELPDPITKVTWTNYAVLSAELAHELGVAEGDMIEITAHDHTVTLPALIEPGVHRQVIAIALGYGRTACGANGDHRGQNAFVFLGVPPRDVLVNRTTGHKDLAKSQTEPSQHGREIVRETTLAAYIADPGAGNEKIEDSKRHLTMWQDHPYPGPKWHLNVDLSACTGCSACVVACQAENNIPTVGELEVLRRRDMAWMRIDRYFAGEGEDVSVLHQPVMCQHCDNAPCETVCPVLATVHSSEGLNQQVYNRCVGTRYCANNCPPKVRRFNWFEYPHEDPLERMVLNPDVVVRSRGVMEKCSFCVQRIQEGKARAKAEGRPVADGDVQTACQQSCPAGAIVFGNIHDPKSRVAAAAADERQYRILEELHIEPAVSYLVKVRAEGSEEHHG